MNVSDGAEPSEPPSPELEMLLGDDWEAVDALLTGDDSGPLAVCSAPFGGRKQVLEHAADEIGTDILELGPDAASETVADALDTGPAVIDGCQHLYERRIGGFEPLNDVLRKLAEPEWPVVLGWNRYAWAYLVRVCGLDRAIPSHATVGPVAAEELSELLLARYDVPEFTVEETSDEGWVSVRRYGVSLAGRTLSLPVPVPTVGPFRTSDGDDPEPVDVAFERLASVSDGNLGVATALWKAQTGETHRPSDIVAAGTDLALDREAAFCLRIVLSKERVERAELDRIVDEPERLVGRLARAGLVRTAGETITLEPAAVPTAVSETERRRFH